MNEILNKLHIDHVNASKLLYLLEAQLMKLEAGDTPNFLLMQDIMRYMVDYSDNVHHPLEEIIFKRLEKIDQNSRQAIRQLYNEHTELVEMGDALTDRLANTVGDSIVQIVTFTHLGWIVGDTTVRVDTITNLVWKYLQLLRSHMHTEEEEIFPWIERLFSVSDWSEITTSLATIEDPLFGKAVQENYRRLCDSIKSEA